MRNGNRTLVANRFAGVVLVIFSLVASFSAYSLDNPDSPNLIAEFDARSKDYLKAIDKPGNSSKTYAIAYYNYEKFLNKELDKAYRLLETKIHAKQLEQLKTSQQLWLRYRDAEFAFITENWNSSNFGSSSVISRGDYRCVVIRDRIIQLLSYVRNY